MNVSELAIAIAPLNLRSCLVQRRGRLIYHYEREPHISTELAKINSCTKSILSALICIAMEQRILPEPDTEIACFFPRLRSDADERKRGMTLRHLLTMTAGFDWTEFGGQNSFPRMTRSADWVKFALEQPLADAPGSRMTYNSGVSQLLAAILAQAAGMSVAQFAELHLFAPLGFRDYEWEYDPQGIHTGGFGLKLAPDDMLKFGLLFLQHGEWRQRQLVAPGLVRSATQAAVAASPPDSGFYGWHWWAETPSPAASPAGASAAAAPYYYARGFGGQFIFVLPGQDTVVVFSREPRKKGPSALEIFRRDVAPLIAADR